MGGTAILTPAPNADAPASQVSLEIALPSIFPTGGNIVPASEVSFSFQVYSKTTNPFIPESNPQFGSGSIRSNVLQANAATIAIPVIHDLPVFHRNLRC